MLQGAAQMRTRVGDDIAVMRKGSIFGEAVLSACCQLASSKCSTKRVKHGSRWSTLAAMLISV